MNMAINFLCCLLPLASLAAGVLDRRMRIYRKEFKVWKGKPIVKWRVRRGLRKYDNTKKQAKIKQGERGNEDGLREGEGRGRS